MKKYTQPHLNRKSSVLSGSSGIKKMWAYQKIEKNKKIWYPYRVVKFSQIENSFCCLTETEFNNYKMVMVKLYSGEYLDLLLDKEGNYVEKHDIWSKMIEIGYNKEFEIFEFIYEQLPLNSPEMKTESFKCLVNIVK